MEERHETINPRLGIDDKRHLFKMLLAMTERLLFLNKFPVDMEDYALSLMTPEVEDAWKLLREEAKKSTSPTSKQMFVCLDNTFYLHTYPGEKNSSYADRMVFMDVAKKHNSEARRHGYAVREWCKRQIRLEEQVLRTAGVIKNIVLACNTVGQYKRVSPDLITFLPDKYALALKGYSKTSPMPKMNSTKKEVDTMLATLAHAAFQPKHTSEEAMLRSMNSWGGCSYDLSDFPRSVDYDRKNVRSLQL